MIRLVCVAVGYIFGLFQTSYLYGRMKGMDIREHGSGERGSHERPFGPWAGRQEPLPSWATALNAYSPCFWCVFFLTGFIRVKNIGVLLGMYAALGVILGHNFPCYLKFHGGKGISATAGLFLSLDPLLTLGALILFAGSVGLTRYVSLGSILVSIWLPVGVVLYGVTGRWGLAQGHLYEMYAIAVFSVRTGAFPPQKEYSRASDRHGEKTGRESRIGQAPRCGHAGDLTHCPRKYKSKRRKISWQR